MKRITLINTKQTAHLKLVVIKTVVLIERFFSHLGKLLLQRIDADLDRTMSLINRFRSYHLYRHSTKVTMEQMNAVEDAFLQLARRNKRGSAMGFGEVLMFYIHLKFTKAKTARSLDYMSDAINTRELLAHVFGLG